MHSRCPPLPSPLTHVGMRVNAHVVSPVFEEHHSLWQWRSFIWRRDLFIAPFLLHCAPGLPLREPFIHHTVIHSITMNKNKNKETGKKGGGSAAALHASPSSLAVPTPIGILPVVLSTCNSAAAAWVEELFVFLERGGAQASREMMTRGANGMYTDVFRSDDGKLPSRTETLTRETKATATDVSNKEESDVHVNTNESMTHNDGVCKGTNNNNNIINDANNCNYKKTLSVASHSGLGVPPAHRNVISCGLAEAVLAIDRYAAMLARREITFSGACWAVLVDSKADVRPYLRCSAVAIEKELIAATAAHEALTRALGDPVNRPLVKLADYPGIVGW